MLFVRKLFSAGKPIPFLQAEFHRKSVTGEILLIFDIDESMMLTIDTSTTTWHLKSRLFSMV
jgi:hypothetical protein